MANEVYLNFESSTPCSADKNFNYTSLISFHCKRGVSMVSVPASMVGVPAGVAGMPRGEGGCSVRERLSWDRRGLFQSQGAELTVSLGSHVRLACICLI